MRLGMEEDVLKVAQKYLFPEKTIDSRVGLAEADGPGFESFRMRLHPKSFSAGPSASAQSTGALNFCPAFHHGKRDAYWINPDA